jgi:hypothetical protein
MSSKPIFALATLLICSPSFAQQRPIQRRDFGPTISPAGNAAAAAAQRSLSVSPSPNATTTCSYTFTSLKTAANKFLQFCVTVNGNIVEFQSPAGVEHLRIGAYTEGYGICDGGVGYFDYADFGDSGNWLSPGPATVTATSVKIPRTTSDGIWTLTQTIALNKAGASANVTMALKNNTAVGRTVTLIRFADVDAGGVVFNNLDGSDDSAWGYNRTGGSTPPYGLLLQTNGPSPFLHEGWAINTPGGPDPCNSGFDWAGTLTNADGGIVLWQWLGNVPKNATKTVKLKYTAF